MAYAPSTIKFIGALSGTELDTDSNKNVLIANGLPPVSQIGGYYTVAGGPAAVVAVSLAANVSLMAMRFNPVSIRRARIERLFLTLSVATVGTSALVPGKLGLQRFRNATPTGGTARTPNRNDESLGSGSDMFDIRDNNAALTVTGINFLDVIETVDNPIGISENLGTTYQIVPQYPLVLGPGDGIALRTQVAMPATQTWVYAHTWFWTEYVA